MDLPPHDSMVNRDSHLDTSLMLLIRQVLYASNLLRVYDSTHKAGDIAVRVPICSQLGGVHGCKQDHRVRQKLYGIVHPRIGLEFDRLYCSPSSTTWEFRSLTPEVKLIFLGI